ncbi:MAG: TonB-dependent receptor [Acidobacteria bacterium]|nr:TonB-dependent receptor [Acidobacteriota bacterium]
MQTVRKLVFSMLFGLLLFSWLTPSVSLAQMTTATVLGAVQDESGAAIPGATVILRNTDTGIVRTVTTDAQGRYNASNLTLGNYELEASLTGFQTEVRRGIRLALGQEATITFTLKVGSVSERIEVFGEAPMVETTSAALTGLVDDKKIRDLPIIGRSFEQLALLQPGVTYQATNTGAANEGGRQSVQFYGASARLNVGGARGNQSTMLVDGININGFYNRGPDSASGLQLGVDAVREFNVLLNNYSAEYGRSSGGVLNIVTRAGTNTLHGSVFEFNRTENLDARKTIDAGKPPFVRNQFGFALGGPIKKDKTFFFGTSEIFRERLGRTLETFVPNAQAREGYLPNAQTGQLQFIGVATNVKPYLDLYPLPNGPNVGDGRAQYNISGSQPTDDSFFQVRIDHQFSANNSLFGRYTFDDASRLNPFSAGPWGTPAAVWVSRFQNVVLAHTSIISPTLLNTFRFGYTRNRFKDDGLNFNPLLNFVPGRYNGTLGVGGLAGLGCSECVPVHVLLNSYEFNEQLSYIKGRHSLKTGAAITYIPSFEDWGWQLNGTYTFSNLSNFLQGNPFQLRASLPGAIAVAEPKVTVFGFHIQDDINLRPGLTLNLGYRYEFTTNVTDEQARFGAVVNFPTATSFSAVKTPWGGNPSLGNFGPRVGIAWDMFGNGKTSLRGGFGVFNEQLLQNVSQYSPAAPPKAVVFSKISPPPRFPDEVTGGFVTLANAALALSAAPNYDEMSRNPYVMQYNLNIQQQISSNTALTASYAGARGVHLTCNRDINTPLPQVLPDGRKFTPAGSQPRNPNLGSLNLFSTSCPSWYNALQVNLNRRFSQGLQFQAAYTFSRTLDHSSSMIVVESGESQGFQDADCRVCEKGLAFFHQAQVLKTNFTYDLPIGSGKRFGSSLGGFAEKLLGGWQINSILSLLSGAPLEISTGSLDRARKLTAGSTKNRPDLRPGFSNNPTEGVTAGCAGVTAGRKLQSKDLWYDPCAFQLQPAGFFGNLGRNTVIGPGLATVDFGLAKMIRLREGTDLQFKAEAFNLFNRVNFAKPNSAVFISTSGVPSATAGRITDTAPARQVQLGLKLTF